MAGGLWSKALSFFVGVGAGGAAGAVAEPVFEPTKQNAWARRPYRVLDPDVAAEAAVKEVGTPVELQDDALRGGVGEARFAVLEALARTFPGLGTLDDLANRELITPQQVDTALARQGYPETYRKALVELFQDLLNPGELAAAIHRGLVPDPGLLQGEQPTSPFKVDAYPVYPIDAVKEAAGSGYDKKRLGVLVGLQGLPMGVIEAAHAYYRKIITHGDYIRAFNTSNSRNEWAAAVLEYARQIPTARDFVENALRGYRTLGSALDGAARHGMSDEDATMLYQNQGRPMVVRQITQALSRGGVFKPEPGELKDPYEASVVEGTIKPAYYDLAKSLRYTLPSPFVMRQLTASGVWSEAKAAKRLKDAGWIPSDADEAAKAWATGGGTTADPHVSKAEVQLWSTLHSSYMSGESDDAVARDKLTTLSVPAGAQATILKLWGEERELIRKQLTPAQIKKLFLKLKTNPATGAPWTRDDALAELLARGYSMDDANSFLGL